MGTHLSVAAYARHRGKSRRAVYDAIEAGRIEKEPDGSIDVEKADRSWTELTGRRRGTGHHAPASSPGAADRSDAAKGGTDDDDAPADAHSLRERQERARTRSMEAEARQDELNADERVGELVNRTLACSEVFAWFRAERDTWRGFAARFSAQIAAELTAQGVSHRSVNAVLEKYVDLFLEERGDVEPPAFRGSAQ